MTRQMRFGNSRSPFGDWIRSESELDSRTYGLSVSDIDWCIHQYATRPDGRGVQNFMFIEEKRFGEKVHDHQRDTLGMIYRFFAPMNFKPISKRLYSGITKGFVSVRFWGTHKLVFSGSGPMDSAKIEWDNRTITLRDLIEILRFEMSPISLRRRDERSHHGGAKQMLLMPQAEVA